MILTLSNAEPETLELSEMLGGVPANTLAAVFDRPADVFERLAEQAVFIASHQ